MLQHVIVGTESYPYPAFVTTILSIDPPRCVNCALNPVPGPPPDADKVPSEVHEEPMLITDTLATPEAPLSLALVTSLHGECV